MFDIGSGTISVHRLGKNVPTEEEIEQYHNDRMAKIGIVYPLKSHFLARPKLIAAKRKLMKDSTISKLRSLRDHTLAHNIEPETGPDLATLNDLLELTEEVNELVDLAGYIVTSSRGVYRDFSGRAEKETRMMYAALPVLANVEEE